MPRARNDFWVPQDEWTFDDDDPDDDANPDNDRCSACGRLAPPGVACQGPGPYPRPCPAGKPMPPTLRP